MPALVSREGCCFDALHIKTATYVVGVIELLFAIAGLFVAVGNLAYDPRKTELMTKVIFAIQIVYLLIYIFLTILLFYGLHQNQASWVFMHLQASACIALCMVIWVILVAIAGLWWNMFYYIILLIFMVFFVYVEYRCYQYMRGL